MKVLAIMLLVLVGAVCVIPVSAQDMTVASCRAAQPMLFAAASNNNVDSMTVDQMVKGLKLMNICGDIDSAVGPHASYLRTGDLLTSQMGKRLAVFVGKHGLWNEFEAEDKIAHSK